MSTKEIRNDLEGFLRSLKNGQTVQVLYRSKPLVTVASRPQPEAFLSEDAGSQSAAKRSVKFVRSLPNRSVKFDPKKSLKVLYDESKNI